MHCVGHVRPASSGSVLIAYRDHVTWSFLSFFYFFMTPAGTTESPVSLGNERGDVIQGAIDSHHQKGISQLRSPPITC
eukprot:360216-Pelagomonas_calceolata.AAC.9